MNNQFKRVVSAIVISSFAVLSATQLPAADAKKKSNGGSCLTGKCPAKVEEVLDPQAQMLVNQLARQPELMNLDYLRYFIGRPENENYERYNLNHKYYWYDNDHRLRYQLEQAQRAPGQVTEATMTVRLDGMGVDFEQIESLYGKPAKKFFDYEAHPSELFMLAPDTFLSFSSQPNTFRVNQAKIQYHGEPLPVPSADDMAAAEAQLIERSSALGSSKNDDELTPETIPLLQAHTRTRPMDAEAHLALARALQRQSRLHEAIGEYKVALAMSGSNENVRNAALDVLRSMHIVDDPNYEGPRRELQLVQKGQRLRVHGKQQDGEPLPQQQ
jgi:hypothetical protein